MEQRLKAIFAETLRIPAASVTENLTMDDAPEWDSLGHMDLIVTLEQSFGVDFDYGEIVKMRSVRAIREILLAKTGQAQDAA